MPTTAQKYARILYAASAFALVLGVFAQVYLAMAAISSKYGSWSSHYMVGYIMAVPILLMVVSAFVGKMPRPIPMLSIAILLLYVLQHGLTRMGIPVAAAFHGVNALVLYTLAHKVAIDSVRLIRRNPLEEVGASV